MSANASIEGLDTSTVHPARRYNYWLGGKDNFAVDRESGDAIARAYPAIRLAALENRGFLQRAVGYLAGEVGLRQFLDIGTGLPTADNTHDVAQRLAPDARVVYVDNDPMVMAHARALLTSTPEGRTRYIEADIRDPERILADPTLRETLDLGRPVGLVLFAVLHFVRDQADARAIVRTLVDALPSGSYLAASITTMDYVPEPVAASYFEARAKGQVDAWARTAAEFAEFFEGLELLTPGIVPVSEWRRDGARPSADQVAFAGAVARKP